MSLSKTSLETLIDLVEIKLSCMEIYDRDDAKEVARLQQCARELAMIRDNGAAAAGLTQIGEVRRRGRPPKISNFSFGG